MRTGAVVILRRDDGAVLMQYRDNKEGIAWPDFWALPSGASEVGEDPKKTAVRELGEESRYVIDESALTLVCQSPQVLRGEEILRSVYVGEYDGIQPIECLEGKTMEFVHPREFPSMKVFEDHVGFIQQAETILSGGNKEIRG